MFEPPFVVGSPTGSFLINPLQAQNTMANTRTFSILLCKVSSPRWNYELIAYVSKYDGESTSLKRLEKLKGFSTHKQDWMMSRIVAYKYTQYTTPRFGGHVRVFLGRP